MSHDLYSPSRGVQYLNCAAAIPRQAGLPEEESGPAAQWGTDSHAYMEKGLRVGCPTTFLAPVDDEDEQEKATCAQVIVDYVSLRACEGGGPVAVRVEERVDPGAFLGIPGVAGYADVILCFTHTLEVIDLKTGRGLVEADSVQLQLYLLGVLNQYWPDRSQPLPFQRLMCTVVQPRASHKDGPIRSAEIAVTQLLALEKQMSEMVALAETSPNPPANPGEKQCQWCRVRTDCPELAAWRLNGISSPIGGNAPVEAKVTQLLGEKRQSSLPDSEIGRIMDMTPSIKAWLDAVKEEALARMRAGAKVPGWKMVEKQSRPTWLLDEEKLLLTLKRMKGVKIADCINQKVKTPLQVMKAVPEAVQPKIEKLWDRPEGGRVLAPDTDPRANTGEWLESVKANTEANRL